jgi:hypothetical protein
MLIKELRDIAQSLNVDEQALADATVLILPENFDRDVSSDELLDTDAAILLAKHLKANGVACKTAYDLGLRPKFIDRRAGELWLGVIVLTVVTNVVSDLIAEWVKSRFKDESSATIHVELMRLENSTLKRLSFKGPPSELHALLASMESGGESKDREIDEHVSK